MTACGGCGSKLRQSLQQTKNSIRGHQSRAIKKELHLENGTFLITGAHGFIGAWVVKRLLAGNARVVIFDQSSDARRLRLIMSDEEIARATIVTGDITEENALLGVINDFGVTHIIHLAGLQVPICRTNPRLGAMVN